MWNLIIWIFLIKVLTRWNQKSQIISAKFDDCRTSLENQTPTWNSTDKQNQDGSLPTEQRYNSLQGIEKHSSQSISLGTLNYYCLEPLKTSSILHGMDYDVGNFLFEILVHAEFIASHNSYIFFYQVLYMFILWILPHCKGLLWEDQWKILSSLSCLWNLVQYLA